MTENRTKFGLRTHSRGLIYEGLHPSLNEALYTATQINIDLTGIDLSHQNLRGLNLDGIKLSNANFSHSDLSGSNMSEAQYNDCDFSGARLFDSCFSYSDFNKCKFDDAVFGATDFSEAKLNSCSFAGTSTFSLNLYNAFSLINTVFNHPDGQFQMTMPPYSLQGFKYPIIFLDDKILIDGEAYNYERAGILELTDKLLLQLLSRKTLALIENEQ